MKRRTASKWMVVLLLVLVLAAGWFVFHNRYVSVITNISFEDATPDGGAKRGARP